MKLEDDRPRKCIFLFSLIHFLGRDNEIIILIIAAFGLPERDRNPHDLIHGMYEASRDATLITSQR